MTRTWQENALEFDQLIRQGKSARLALLVACSVEPGKGTGSNQHTKVGATKPTTDKVSATTFARKAKTTKDRILRHLAAWDKVANGRDKLVPLAATLKPSSAETFGEITEEAQDLFDSEYREIVRELAPKPEPMPEPEPEVTKPSKTKGITITDTSDTASSRYQRMHKVMLEIIAELAQAVEESMSGVSSDDETVMLQRDLREIARGMTALALAVGTDDGDKALEKITAEGQEG